MTRTRVCHFAPSPDVTELCRLTECIARDIQMVEERAAAMPADHYDFLLRVLGADLAHRKAQLDHLILTGASEKSRP